MPDVVVDILLATFRGERWLPAQLDSLLAQTLTNWRVIARDDGSDDNTRSILESYAARHPGRFLILPHDGRNLRACGNFFELLRHSTAPYVAFCDQDDVWHPERLAHGLSTVKSSEKSLPPGTPVLAHGDLRVVDAELQPIASSFARLQRLDLRKGGSFRRLLMQNVVTGCTVTINRALALRAFPVPGGAIMHDYWLALVAAAFGRCVVQDGTLVDYRQHGGNTIGAKRFSVMALLQNRNRLRPSALREALAAHEAQAHAFNEHYGKTLSSEHQIELAAFLRLFTSGFLHRRGILFRHGFWKHGWIRNVGLLALV